MRILRLTNSLFSHDRELWQSRRTGNVSCHLISLCTVTISVRMDKPVDCISHWIDSIADRVPDKHTGSSSSSYHLFFPQTILQMATGIASIYRFTIRWLILLQASIRKWTAVHLVYHCTTRSRTLLDREWSVQLWNRIHDGTSPIFRCSSNLQLHPTGR